MSEAIFVSQDMFKIAGKGVLVSGFLKSGTLKVGMEAEIKKQKVALLSMEAFNQKMEEVKDSDPAAKALGIILPESSEKLFPASEIVFKESK